MRVAQRALSEFTCGRLMTEEMVGQPEDAVRKVHGADVAGTLGDISEATRHFERGGIFGAAAARGPQPPERLRAHSRDANALGNFQRTGEDRFDGGALGAALPKRVADPDAEPHFLV